MFDIDRDAQINQAMFVLNTGLNEYAVGVGIDQIAADSDAVVIAGGRDAFLALADQGEQMRATKKAGDREAARELSAAYKAARQAAVEAYITR